MFRRREETNNNCNSAFSLLSINFLLYFPFFSFSSFFWVRRNMKKRVNIHHLLSFLLVFISLFSFFLYFPSNFFFSLPFSGQKKQGETTNIIQYFLYFSYFLFIFFSSFFLFFVLYFPFLPVLWQMKQDEATQGQMFPSSTRNPSSSSSLLTLPSAPSADP